MKATVMTTGPGVIIATATASRNWRSESQCSWFTTPPWRKGTIASPLPNTNAPAFAKNTQIVESVAGVAGPPRPLTSHGRGRQNAAVVATAGRRPRASSAATPEAMKSHTSSDSVQPVTSAFTTNSIQSSGSPATVERVSLYALRAMIAITAAPTP